jgi:hypothetical protein
MLKSSRIVKIGTVQQFHANANQSFYGAVDDINGSVRVNNIGSFNRNLPPEGVVSVAVFFELY